MLPNEKPEGCNAVYRDKPWKYYRQQLDYRNPFHTEPGSEIAR
jgi:hypothetical protein